jgi:hypothetical protein
MPPCGGAPYWKARYTPPKRCRTRSTMLQNGSHKKQRRQGRGLASLMWPTKPWPGVSFACLPLRSSPNEFRCVVRLILRRWRH